MLSKAFFALMGASTVLGASGTSAPTGRGSGTPAPTGPPPVLYSLEVSCMQDAARKTDVYVTVRKEAASVPPAIAQHIQLKTFDINGQLQWVKNEMNVPLSVTGAVSGVQFSFPDMDRTQPVQAQVQVPSPAGGNKVEVIRTKAKVMLRPDFKLMEARAPKKAHIGQAVMVEVDVQELNGDLGGGAEVCMHGATDNVDHCASVQVNALGKVTLVFATSFAQSGTYTLSNVIESVTPSDYDTSVGHTLDVTIEVTPNLESVPGSVYYNYYHNDYEWHSRGLGYSSDYYQTYKSSTIQAQLYLSDVNLFPLTVSIDIVPDGVSAFKTEVAMPTPETYSYQDWWYGWSFTRNWKFVQLSDGFYVYADQYIYGGQSFSYVTMVQYATDYVWFSSSYYEYYGTTQTYQSSYHGGTPILASNEIKVRLVATVADGTGKGGDLTAPVSNSPIDYTWDYCYWMYCYSGITKGMQSWAWYYGMTTP